MKTTVLILKSIPYADNDIIYDVGGNLMDQFCSQQMWYFFYIHDPILYIAEHYNGEV